MKVFISGMIKETKHHSRGASHAPLLALESFDFSCQFTPHGDRCAVASPSAQQRGWLVGRVVLVALTTLLGEGFGMAEVPTPTKVEDVVRVLKANPRATPEDLLVAGSGVEVVLTDLLVSREVDREVRLRAAWALGGYPGPRARAVLVSTLSDHVEDAAVRAAAMIGYARLAGTGAIVDLKPYLKDARPELRVGAARAIAVAGGPQAREILTEALAHEEDLDVRLAMDKALKEMK